MMFVGIASGLCRNLFGTFMVGRGFEDNSSRFGTFEELDWNCFEFIGRLSVAAIPHYNIQELLRARRQ